MQLIEKNSGDLTKKRSRRGVYKLGMCNINRVLEYSAVTAMIDHENYDRGEKQSDWF